MGIIEELREKIEKQRKGHEDKPRWMIGEQLIDIAMREPVSAELICKDLDVKALSLEAAENAFAKYAREHRKGQVFCITPKVAEGLLREMYGLPDAEEQKTEQEPAEPEGYIDLAAFL